MALIGKHLTQYTHSKSTRIGPTFAAGGDAVGTPRGCHCGAAAPTAQKQYRTTVSAAAADADKAATGPTRAMERREGGEAGCARGARCGAGAAGGGAGRGQQLAG